MIDEIPDIIKKIKGLPPSARGAEVRVQEPYSVKHLVISMQYPHNTKRTNSMMGTILGRDIDIYHYIDSLLTLVFSTKTLQTIPAGKIRCRAAREIKDKIWEDGHQHTVAPGCVLSREYDIVGSSKYKGCGYLIYPRSWDLDEWKSCVYSWRITDSTHTVNFYYVPH